MALVLGSNVYSVNDASLHQKGKTLIYRSMQKSDIVIGLFLYLSSSLTIIIMVRIYIFL